MTQPRPWRERPTYTTAWQATPRPAAPSTSGSTPRHRSAIPNASASPEASTGHRGWNRHPAGTAPASGVSPLKITAWPRNSGDDRQQGPGIRVLRRRQHLLDGPALDDTAQVHHRDPVGDVPRQPEVVRHHQGRQPGRVAQVEQQPRISPRTEASSEATGSSATSTRRVQRQRAGDHHALALAAGQLVRVQVEETLAAGAARRAPRRRSPWTARWRPRPRRTSRGCASPSATASYTVCRGLSAPVGSWSTNCTSRR